MAMPGARRRPFPCLDECRRLGRRTISTGTAPETGVDLAIWCLRGRSRNLIQVRATRTPTRTYRDWENEVGRERLNFNWFGIFW